MNWSRRACVRHPWWRTKAKRAIVFTYFLFFFFFFLLVQASSQRSVTEPGPTPSPWSICYGINVCPTASGKRGGSTWFSGKKLFLNGLATRLSSSLCSVRFLSWPKSSSKKFLQICVILSINHKFPLRTTSVSSITR